MSMTFTTIVNESIAQTEDTDAATAVLLKRAVNQGFKRFGAVLNREWRTTEKTFSTVANQQFYQMPEDCIRIKNLVVSVGNVNYPIEELADDDQWNSLNLRTQSSSYPRFYYVKGSDQFGVWPSPSGVATGTLTYERSMRDMAADDYITGTITMVNGTPDVVGSGTTFTANMVGRTLFVTDGSADGMGYKISSFTDTTHITLENNYGGTAGAAKTYLIGEVPDIPEEYHESLVDYACFRYYRRRRDANTANDFYALFKESLAECQSNYSSKTSSQYTRAPRVRYGYSQFSNVNRQVT